MMLENNTMETYFIEDVVEASRDRKPTPHLARRWDEGCRCLTIEASICS